MACRLKAPSHYQNQCWFLIGTLLYHSPESNFTQATILYNEFEKHTTHNVSPNSQWVNISDYMKLTNMKSCFGWTNNGIIKVHYTDCLVQDCGISIANAMEIPQSCTKPLMYHKHDDTDNLNSW